MTGITNPVRQTGDRVPERLVPFQAGPLEAHAAAADRSMSLEAGPPSVPSADLTLARPPQNLFAEVSGAPFTKLNPKLAGRLVSMPATPPGAVEQYRKLAATLHLSHIERELRVIMVTSALPGDGKTLTAANLALTLSESYHRRVLLIDADLRRPAMYDIFQLPNIAGLSDWLKASSQRKVPVVHVSEHLTLLPAGHPDPNPISSLTSDRMARLLKDAAATFDWVIVDTPPIGVLTDANLMGDMVDGALLVIRAKVTPFAMIERAMQALGRDRLLGVVMNGTDEGLSQQGYEAYYGYGPGPRNSKSLTGR